jgi:hypothetical protein
MNVLVACEMFGRVREAFIKKGHNAYSCDIQPDINNSPNHYCGDVRPYINDQFFDLMIAFPPCDRILGAGALYWEKWQASGEQQAGIEFFMLFTNSKIKKVAIENPVGIMSTVWRKPDQKINPYQFGHMEQKRTCIWVKGLPLLVPTNNVYAEMMKLPKAEREKVHYMSASVKNGLTRSQRRAITYQGIADAMADQWG